MPRVTKPFFLSDPEFQKIEPKRGLLILMNVSSYRAIDEEVDKQAGSKVGEYGARTAGTLVSSQGTNIDGESIKDYVRNKRPPRFPP